MTDGAPRAIEHGGATLTAVTVDAYNAELRDAEGFIGDRASSRAFRSLLDDVRERLADAGHDPLEGEGEEIGKEALDKVLAEGAPEAAGVVHTAIEDFAQEFSAVIRRFLRLKEWRGTERIVVGGGLRGSRVGELAMGRTAVLLHGDGVRLDLLPIQHDPDHAGLIGGAHLAPPEVLAGHDSVLAMDIGGTNVRVGVVALNLAQGADLSGAAVVHSEGWRHRDDSPTRTKAVDRIGAMLSGMVGRAGRDGLNLAPFVAVGCPGLIAGDGRIERGGQNLPGNWEHERFNLPDRLRAGLPQINGRDTQVAMHNDAVVQGLSQVPFMQDVERWGVMTVGTGLGNARFTNRRG